MHLYTKQNVNVKGIYTSLFLVTIFFSILLGYFIFHIIKKQEVDGILSIYSLVLSGMPLIIFSMILWILNKWIWKWKIVNSFINVPNLSGKYEGYLKSSFDNFSKKYDFYLTITQNFNEIEIFLEMVSGSSKSYSISVYIKRKHNEAILVYNYQNEPLDKVSPTLTEHKGTAVLRFNLQDKTFVGSYYADKRPISDNEAKCNFGEIKGKINDKY